jgi:toxin secretion/phage lysis holin
MIWDKIVKYFALAIGAIAGFWGGLPVMVQILAWAMLIDYLSGLIVAWRRRSPKSESGGVSSAVGFDGLAKKAFIILIVLLATMLDRVLGTDMAVFQTAAASYYLANEGLSIIENAALMGVNFPPKIKDALEALKKKGDSEDPPDPEV